MMRVIGWTLLIILIMFGIKGLLVFLGVVIGVPAAAIYLS